MLDKLYDLVLGEKGFLVKIRCENTFDDEIYSEIKSILRELVAEWKSLESIPKKGFLAVVELVDFLSRNSKFLSEEDSLKVEDAGIEIKDMINDLY